jgi:hypothetical protein
VAEGLDEVAGMLYSKSLMVAERDTLVVVEWWWKAVSMAVDDMIGEVWRDKYIWLCESSVS